MGAFTFKLEFADGTLANPPVLRTVVPTWAASDTIPIGRGASLRVVEVREAAEDEEPVLVVEPV
jgi:hypothetical protein